MPAPTTDSALPCSVLVAGDVVWDDYVFRGSQRRAGSLIPRGTLSQRRLGGAAMIARLLKSVAARNPDLLSVSRGFVPRRLQGAPVGYCAMRPYPQEERQVWRVAETLGLSDGAPDLDPDAADQSALRAPHRVVVLDDAGLLFRRWPARAAWPGFLTDKSIKIPDWIVLKMASPVAAGDLWHTLVSGETQDEPPATVREGAMLRSRTCAVISIRELRGEAIYVSKDLSWERAALDLVHELGHNPDLEALRRLRFVIVGLGADGALIASFPEKGEARFRLVFDPARLEGDFEKRIQGSVFGSHACFTAAIAAKLAAQVKSGGDKLDALEAGVRSGLSAMRALFEEGYGAIGSRKLGYPHRLLAGEIVKAEPTRSFGAIDVPRPESSELRHTDAPRWTVVAGTPDARSVPLFGLARRVALKGLEKLEQTPYLEFGKLFSIDRSEIESLRTVQRLLLNYANDSKARKPLSIAVFGPPGAGKSFGVRELANAVLPGEVQLLEFNLSQFKSPSELHGLFHQVRDAALYRKLPVAFWDEFDSRDLDWLQYLLAPMQDGTFQEDQITHPIGKSVFVFAGGTRSTFGDFGKLSPELRRKGNEAKEEEFVETFKARKGPDFKSRLAGYIDVLGPNPRDEQDITYPIRRALMLRVHLHAGGKAPLIIDRGLLTAFLSVDAYRHGSRSLEKLAEQVRMASPTGEFTRSDLPPRSLLDLYVDAGRFLDLMEREI